MVMGKIPRLNDEGKIPEEFLPEGSGGGENKEYIDAGDAKAVNDANEYTNGRMEEILMSDIFKQYIDGGDEQTLTDAKAYTNEQLEGFEGGGSGNADEALRLAKEYTDEAIAPIMEEITRLSELSDEKAVDPDDVGYDVILAAGQSNMWGQYGPVDADVDISDPRVFQYPASGTKQGKIVIATEPVAHPETPGYGPPSGMGPALVFSRLYASSIPSNRKVLIVPRAIGSSTLGTDWNPSGSSNLFTQAITAVKNALALAGPNSRFVGMIWLQGESDGLANMSKYSYEQLFDQLVSKLRSDLDSPNAIVAIAGMVPTAVQGTIGQIRQAHEDSPSRLQGVGYTPGPEGMAADSLHYTGAGQRILGRDLFYRAWRQALNNPVTPVDPTVPNSPINFLGLVGDKMVNLSWSPPNNGGSTITEYILERKTSAETSWTGIGSYLGTSTSITGLTNGVSYDFRLAAKNAIGLSPWSNTSATPVAPPQNTWPVVESFTSSGDITSRPSDSGANWTRVAGTGSISSSSGVGVVSGASVGFNIWKSDKAPTSQNYSVETDVIVRNTNTSAGPAAFITEDSFVGVFLGRGNVGTLLIEKKGAAVKVLADGSSLPALTTGKLYRTSLEVKNTELNVFIFDPELNSWMDDSGTWTTTKTASRTAYTSLTLPGTPGLVTSDGSNPTFDNFTAK